MKRSPLAVIFLTVLLDLLGFGIVIPILPTYALRFEATALVAMLLQATYSLFQFLFAPVWGRWSDRIGRRPIIVGTALGATVSYVAFGFSDALWMLFAARALSGVCGANISTAQAFIADVTTPEDRARGMAIVGAGFALGFTLGPALAAGATWVAGHRAPFFVAAGLALANAAWAFVALPKGPPPNPATRRPGRAAAFRDALRIPNLGFLIGLFFVVTYAFSNIESSIVVWTHAELGFGERDNGLLFTYIGLVLAAMQAVAVRPLAARFGERPLIVAGTLAMGAGAALVPPSSVWWMLALPATFIAAGNALCSPALMASISNAAPPDRQGEMLGVTQSAGAVARILGPVVAGVLFDFAGHAWPYVSAAALMLLASLAAFGRARAAAPRS